MHTANASNVRVKLYYAENQGYDDAFMDSGCHTKKKKNAHIETTAVRIAVTIIEMAATWLWNSALAEVLLFVGFKSCRC